MYNVYQNNARDFIDFQAQYLSDMSKWIDKKSGEIKSFDDFNRGVISWTGIYTIASFNEFDIGWTAFEKFKVCF